MPHWIKRFIGSILGIALALVPAALIWWQRDNIIDYFKLRNYSPSASIAALAADDTMTNTGKHLFYINHPQLVSNRSDFQKDCTVTEQAIVEGCYHSVEDGIFIYAVSDPRLSGIEQVTAAHEMLHGAYDRLSSSDKTQLDGWLMDYYQHDLTNPRIKQEIKLYQQTEPNDWVNEMHSVFGTEISNLPAPLENYYKRYFTNRAKIVDYSNQYEAQFTNQLNQINADDAQLASMKQQIDADQATINAESAKIEADRARLDSLKASGGYATYNQSVGSFNAEVDTYNAKVAQLEQLINQYNQLVVARNNLADGYRSLQGEIDTRPQTQATQ